MSDFFCVVALFVLAGMAIAFPPFGLFVIAWALATR